MKHASWDGGAISEHPMFVSVLGRQRTIKTRCGKRVSMSKVDNYDITCAGCLDDINRQAQGLDRIRQYADVLSTQGLEAANKLAEGWR